MALGLRILPLLLTLVNQDPNNEDKEKVLPSISGFFNSAPTTSGQKEQDLLNKAGFTDTFSKTTAFFGGASAAALAQVVYELNKEMSNNAYIDAKNAYKSANQADRQAKTRFKLAKQMNPPDNYLNNLVENKSAAEAAADESAKAAQKAAQKAAFKSATAAAKEAAEAAATAAAKAADEAKEAAEALKEANKARTLFTNSGIALSNAQKAQQEALESLKANPKGKLFDAANKITERVTKLEDTAKANWYKRIGQYASKFKNNPKAYIIPGAALAGLTAEMMFGDDRSDNKLNCKFNTDSGTLDFTVSGQNGDLFQASSFRFKVDNGVLMLSQNTKPITEINLDKAISGSRNTVQVVTGGTSGSTGTPPASNANNTPGTNNGSTGTPPAGNANNTPGTNNGNTGTPPDPNSAHTLLLTLAEIANENQKVEIKDFLLANFSDSSKVPNELIGLYNNLNASTPGAPAAPGATATDGAPATPGAAAPASTPAAPGAPAAPAAVNNIESVLDKIDKLTDNTPEVKLLKDLVNTLANKSDEIDRLEIAQKKKEVLELARILAVSLTELPKGSIDEDKLVTIINNLFDNQ
jgi:chemotaxis protein histidine kinase CheA